MKLSFSLKSTEPTITTIIETNNAEIVDAVIGQISARTSEELLTVGGKALLKEEMLEEINAIINEATAGNEEIKRNIIKKLFFTSFVIK
jgi:flagellar FliL protein